MNNTYSNRGNGASAERIMKLSERLQNLQVTTLIQFQLYIKTKSSMSNVQLHIGLILID